MMPLQTRHKMTCSTALKMTVQMPLLTIIYAQLSTSLRTSFCRGAGSYATNCIAALSPSHLSVNMQHVLTKRYLVCTLKVSTCIKLYHMALHRLNFAS